MDNFSHQYFGKNLNELEYSDISNFFTEEKEESDKIEFKSYPLDHSAFNKNIEGVIKGICAFLNSGGGILIWGAPVGQKKDDKVIFQGTLTPLNEFKNKDSLVSKISDSITPLPVDFNIQILEFNKTYLYIFEIQKSNYSPHQYKDTYWARLDGLTKAAPHYLIDALFKKVTYPNIEGYINLDAYQYYDLNKFYLDISIIIINFSELQNEYNLSYRLTCPQAVFAGSTDPKLTKHYSLDGHQFINNGLINTLHFGAPEINSQRLIFDSKDTFTGNYEMDLILLFGGKKSPLKWSEYKLNFKNGQMKSNPIELFQDKKENISAIDKQKQLGITRELILKGILKR